MPIRSQKRLQEGTHYMHTWRFCRVCGLKILASKRYVGGWSLLRIVEECVNANYPQDRINPQLEKSKQPWVPSKNYGARNTVFSQKWSGARKAENINKHKVKKFHHKPISSTIGVTQHHGRARFHTGESGNETPSLPPLGLIVSWHEVTIGVWVGMDDLKHLWSKGEAEVC